MRKQNTSTLTKLTFFEPITVEIPNKLQMYLIKNLKNYKNI